MMTEAVVQAASPTPKTLFVQALGGLVAGLRQAFLPHLAAGAGLVLMTAFVSYVFILAPAHLPEPLEWTVGVLLLAVYGLAGFGYALLTACVFGLRAACASWDAFIEDMLDLVKEKAASKIENMQEGLAKDQAKVLVAGSVREVAGLLGSYEYKSWLRWLAAALLGVLTFAMRSVLWARIVQLSGTTVQLGKLFAGRATLAGAVFLNLRLFSAVFLWLLYALGILVVLLNFLVMFWFK